MPFVLAAAVSAGALAAVLLSQDERAAVL